jgi:hypothetical protein
MLSVGGHNITERRVKAGNLLTGSAGSRIAARAMTAHQQVWAKVNAPVDRRVVGIVEALSLFPYLETIESCEGNGREAVWVCFKYGRYWDDPWRELAKFIFVYFAPTLGERVSDDASILLRPRPGGAAIADLSIRPEAKDRVEKVIRKMASEFSDAPRRRSAYCDGKSGTSPEHC